MFARTHTLPAASPPTAVRLAVFSAGTVLTNELISPEPHGLTAMKPAETLSTAMTFTTATPSTCTAVSELVRWPFATRVSSRRFGAVGRYDNPPSPGPNQPATSTTMSELPVKVSTHTEPSLPIPTNTDDAVECLARALTLDDNGGVPHGPGYAASTVGNVGSATVRFNHTAVASSGTSPSPRIASSVCELVARTPVISRSCTAAPRVSIQRVGGIGWKRSPAGVKAPITSTTTSVGLEA